MIEYEAPAVTFEGELEVKAGSWWCDEELDEWLDFEDLCLTMCVKC